MGFFSSSKKQRSSGAKPVRPSLKSSSLTSPPNVYATSPPPQRPRLPLRPATAGPEHTQGFYNNAPWGASPPPLPLPAGYLPPPPGAPPPYSYAGPVVPYNQIAPAPVPIPHQQPYQQRQNSGNGFSLGRWSESAVDLVQDFIPGNGNALRQWTSSTAAAYDEIRNRFDDVMTLIDRESLSGYEKSLFLAQETTSNSLVQRHPDTQAQSYPPDDSPQTERALFRRNGDAPKKKGQVSQTAHITASVVSGNYFSKVEMYANSKLPLNLAPLRLSINTWPLLCLAAQYSQTVYTTPRGAERSTHLPSSHISGTKAMRIKSVPMDHASTIVFAIRGTSSFMDWAVNLNTSPTPPTNFLDDAGNLCHGGFLSVARKMVRPVAERLRQMLQEQPGRADYSLLITGHSAGGAVAALLYMHMLARNSDSESDLNVLAGCFKRIHCVTFGAPPISLLPLMKPNRPELRKSMFLNFVNEGDPVVRADKGYVKSLLELLANPPPALSASPPLPPRHEAGKPSRNKKKQQRTQGGGKQKRSHRPAATWEVPPCTLSNAGRIVVLRTADPYAQPADLKTVRERLDEGVVAVTCQDEDLRGVIWGDPVAHMMSLYAGRIEKLAVGAVTAKKT